MGDMRGAYGVLVGDQKERPLVGVDGRTMLKWIFKTWDDEEWTDLTQYRDR
jgi:hypothetical protein